MTGVAVLNPELNPERASIFRIVHVANVARILARGGLPCRNAPAQDPQYVNIGNPDLIDKRARCFVPLAPGGTLSDYVPFYFTPFSIMLYNILTGHGVIRRAPQDIVMLVSSIPRLRKLALPFLYTNQHAYSMGADFYDSTGDLSQIDWPLLQRRDFQQDNNDPGKQLRYHAEVLVRSHVPLHALRGIVCYNDAVRHKLETQAEASGASIAITTFPKWYFSL